MLHTKQSHNKKGFVFDKTDNTNYSGKDKLEIRGKLHVLSPEGYFLADVKNAFQEQMPCIFGKQNSRWDIYIFEIR